MTLPKKPLDEIFLKNIQDAALSKNSKEFRKILNDILKFDEGIDICADISDCLDRLDFIKNRKTVPLKKQISHMQRTIKNLEDFSKIVQYRLKVARFYIHNYGRLLN